MENYFYKCPLCGYVHLIPAYWVSFSPEEEMSLQHVNMETKEFCSSEVLYLVRD
ncbi:MAG: hypothetical protein N3B21_14535 [Clostridia bacterium]|nr:hypothetical protein [Clostridia bacterium]